MTRRYCLDTSFLINGWRKRYRIDVFPSIWESIDHHMESGLVFSCHEVLEELKKKKDDLLQWSKARPHAFEKPNAEILTEIRRLMTAYPAFAAAGGSLNAADPWIISHASVAGAIVVTDEEVSQKQKPTKPPKIPNICETEKIEWMSPIDFFASIGIGF